MNFFKMMCDELVLCASKDPELKDALEWVDDTAHKKGITTYDRIYEILQKHGYNINAKNWFNVKQNHPTVTKS